MFAAVTFVKALGVAVILLLLGYLGLDVPRETVEGVVDEYVDAAVAVPEIEPESGDDDVYSVARVIDGDTIVVLTDMGDQSVRIIGIDAPETEYSPAGAECFNTDATNAAEALLSETEVTLTTDPTQATYDTYDRLLAYVTLADGRDFGEVMLAGGYVREFTYKKPYQKQQLYQATELEAYETDRGLWSCVAAEL